MHRRQLPATQAPGRDPLNLALLPEAPVWVLDDPRSPAAGQASAIAGRLGLPFRRLSVSPDPVHRPGGPGPGLVLSAGTHSGLRALLLRSRHGCRVVHCAHRRLPARNLSGWLPYDLTIMPDGYAWSLSDAAMFTGPGAAAPFGNVIPVLGMPNMVSPGLLGRARDLWMERLSHLPQPRIALLFGGSDPAKALVLGQHIAGLAARRGASVMASAFSPGPASDALSAGLSACMHLLYRAGEPGENPTLGFLGIADAVIVAGVNGLTLSEACAAPAPIFAVALGSESRATGRLLDRMRRAGQLRMLADDLSPWPRQPLDEAGRVAREIRTRFGAVAGRRTF